jgi:cytochrome b involved in lipid metabolism
MDVNAILLQVKEPKVALGIVLIIIAMYYMFVDDGRASDEVEEKMKGPFTMEEVAKHNREGDAWIVVEGRVFDVTKYIDEHPGGVKALRAFAGKDATKAFRGPQHGTQVDDVIELFLIGDLAK